MLKSSPSSSEDALTSLRPDLPLKKRVKKQFTKQPGLPTVDRFLSHLGDPGRYQIIIMVLLAANCIPVVVNHLLMAFYAVKTPFNCKVRRPVNLRVRTTRKIENLLETSCILKFAGCFVVLVFLGFALIEPVNLRGSNDSEN